MNFKGESISIYNHLVEVFYNFFLTVTIKCKKTNVQLLVFIFLTFFFYSYFNYYIICYFMTFKNYLLVENIYLFFIIVIMLLISRDKKVFSFIYFIFIVLSTFICLNILVFIFLNSFFFYTTILNISVYNGFFIINYFVLLSKIFIIIFFCLLLLLYYKLNSRLTLDYILVLFFSLFGLLLLISSNDYLIFYLSLEVVSFSLYILIGLENKNIYSIEASLKYFILNALSSGFFLLGLLLFYYQVGSLQFDILEENFLILSYYVILIKGYAFYLNKLFLSHGFILLILFFKLGLVPLHFWLPDVYEGSSFFTMIFMVIVIKSGYFFSFLRLFFLIPNYYELRFKYLVLMFSFLSIVLGSLIALRQKRLKRLLAYTSITNMGYIVLMLNFDTYFSITYFIIYIFINFIFFFIILHLHKKKKLIYLVDLKGVVSIPLIYHLVFLIFIFASIPPSPLFFFKSCLFLTLYESNNFIFIFAIIISSLISIFYYLRLIQLLLSGLNQKRW